MNARKFPISSLPMKSPRLTQAQYCRLERPNQPSCDWPRSATSTQFDASCWPSVHRPLARWSQIDFSAGNGEWALDVRTPLRRSFHYRFTKCRKDRITNSIRLNESFHNHFIHEAMTVVGQVTCWITGALGRPPWSARPTAVPYHGLSLRFLSHASE